MNITIFEDQALENSESFFVNLTTADPDIIFDISAAVVTIANDDGEFIVCQSLKSICYVKYFNLTHRCISDDARARLYCKRGQWVCISMCPSHWSC